jgi:hypothetical protein
MPEIRFFAWHFAVIACQQWEPTAAFFPLLAFNWR